VPLQALPAQPFGSDFHHTKVMAVNMTRSSMILHLSFIVAFCLTLSCDKEPDFDLNCHNLKEGIVHLDEPAIKAEISKLTQDLKPNPTAGDEYGHLKNFDLLVRRLNQCGEINAELSCYCCIYTYPPQSEILITTSFNEEKIHKIFDILTSKDTILVFLRMHDAY
jgi:hypothetical protein